MKYTTTTERTRDGGTIIRAYDHKNELIKEQKYLFYSPSEARRAFAKLLR